MYWAQYLIDDRIARASYRWKTEVPTEEEKWLMDHVEEWVGEGLITT